MPPLSPHQQGGPLRDHRARERKAFFLSRTSNKSLVAHRSPSSSPAGHPLLPLPLLMTSGRVPGRHPLLSLLPLACSKWSRLLLLRFIANALVEMTLTRPSASDRVHNHTLSLSHLLLSLRIEHHELFSSTVPSLDRWPTRCCGGTRAFRVRRRRWHSRARTHRRSWKRVDPSTLWIFCRSRTFPHDHGASR